MEITEDNVTHGHTITSYGAGYLAVNETIWRQSLIISPEKLDTDWPASTPADLTLQNLQYLEDWQPEVVIIGTGEKQVFPEPEVTAFFLSRGIGCEVMDSAAACRTYTILLSENRKVVAALLLP